VYGNLTSVGTRADVWCDTLEYGALFQSKRPIPIRLLSPFRGLQTAVFVLNGRTLVLQLHSVSTDHSALAAVINM